MSGFPCYMDEKSVPPVTFLVAPEPQKETVKSKEEKSKAKPKKKRK